MGVVVSSDIAVYPKGPARPTGGAGVISFLIGPNAPIRIEPVRATFIDNQYDFFKPNPCKAILVLIMFVVNEYPLVDGHHSMNIYIGALLNCWDTFDRKYKLRYGVKAPKYQDFSYFCFHTPFSKMVQKSFYSLVLHDMKQSHSFNEQRYPK